MGNLKRMIFGQKMPDKNDPNYKEKYEKDVEAGRRFARLTRLDRLTGHIQRFANKHTKLFLAIVFAVVISCFVVNLRNISKAYKHQNQLKSATELQEQRLRERLKAAPPINPNIEQTPSTEEDGTTTQN